MRKILIVLFLLWGSASYSQGFMGIKVTDLKNSLLPRVGTLIISDTQTLSGFYRAWSAEGTLFYDSANQQVKIYFTGGRDSAGSAAVVNRIWYTTTTDMVTFTTPQVAFGTGVGSGVPSNRKATSSWVGKVAGKYYAIALNGYPLQYAGQDQNMYGYSSDDGVNWTNRGMVLNKNTAWTDTLGGFGNIGVVVDQYNNAQIIGGKYVAVVEIWSGTNWYSYRGQADSLMGDWTLTNLLSSLQPVPFTTAGYGGPQVIYYKGKYYNFYHYTYPTNLCYAVSSDLITWTVKEAPFRIVETTPFANTDQMADPSLCEINGKVYMIANYCQNSPNFRAQIRLWTYDGTFSQMLSQLPQ